MCCEGNWSPQLAHGIDVYNVDALYGRQVRGNGLSVQKTTRVSWKYSAKWDKEKAKWDCSSVYAKPHKHIKQCYIFKNVNQDHEKGCLQGEEQMVRGSGDWEKIKIKENHFAQTELLWNEENDHCEVCQKKK